MHQIINRSFVPATDLPLWFGVSSSLFDIYFMNLFARFGLRISDLQRFHGDRQ